MRLIPKKCRQGADGVGLFSGKRDRRTCGRKSGQNSRHQGIRIGIASTCSAFLARPSRHEDGAARLWDPATGRPVTPPVWHDGPVLAVVFSPDGGSFLAGTQDGFAYLSAVPLPWRGSPGSTREWVQVNANLELDPSGDARPLALAAWRQVLGHLRGGKGAESVP